MDVTRLAFADQSFDAAVATFLFCVLPDDRQEPALREIGRVVKSGGTIRLLEYVRPRGVLRSAITRLWEPWVAWLMVRVLIAGQRNTFRRLASK
jgi:ubiquinone/menaquinone biosynthesis C-methylase UbiE